MSDLKARIVEETKLAMKARDRQRVAALRLVNAELKRVEVDERRELSDDDVILILERMLKQRRDALGQYEQAGRDDLAAQERYEIELVETFMPQAMSEAEIRELVERVIAQAGAGSMQDMGRVMGAVKSALTGRADMKLVSAVVKESLSA
jgi:uncharacterized protein YqeY